MLVNRVLLVAVSFLSLTSSYHLPSLLQSRQIDVADCGPAPFQVRQFSTYTGGASSLASVSFFLTNDHTREELLCVATMSPALGCQSDNFWYCPDGETLFQWTRTDTLSIWQNMTCARGSFAGDLVQVEAQGYIDTVGYPDEYYGWHAESTAAIVSVPIVNVVPV